MYWGQSMDTEGQPNEEETIMITMVTINMIVDIIMNIIVIASCSYIHSFTPLASYCNNIVLFKCVAPKYQSNQEITFNQQCTCCILDLRCLGTCTSQWSSYS